MSFPSSGVMFRNYTCCIPVFKGGCHVLVLSGGQTNLSHDGAPKPSSRSLLAGEQSDTGWDFCVSMIGRADIEGSKSNVAMRRWLGHLDAWCQLSLW